MRALVFIVLVFAVSAALAGDVEPESPEYRAAIDAELSHHKERRSRLLDLHAKAVAQEKPDLVERIAKVKEKENRRHLKAIARIKREHMKEEKRDDKRDATNESAKPGHDDAKRTKVVKKSARGEQR